MRANVVHVRKRSSWTVEGAVRTSVAEAGGSSRIFKEYIGDITQRIVAPSRMEARTASHWLEVGGT